MATTVGQHSVAAFTSPVNGTTPIDANTVRGNDNTVRVAYVDHDADPGIHVQSSTLASRPAAGTAGRKWINSDYPQKLWYDDGTDWHEVGGDAINVYCKATEVIAKGDVVKVTGYNTGQDVPEIAKVSSASDVAFGIAETAIANGSLGYVINTGVIQGVTTNSFSLGNILYPNTSGGLTATKPTSGNYQAVAYVLRAHASSGVLYVEFSAPRIVERSNNEASTIVLRDASGNFAAGTITAGALTSTGLVTFASLKGTGATTVTNILDEDNMASDSATALATQQSIKAYVDAQVATADTLAEVLANGNTTGANNIIVSSGQKITTNTIDETTAAAGVTIDSVLLKDDVVNATDIEVDTISANNGTLAVTLGSTGVATIAQQPIVSSLTASQAVFTDASKGLVSNAITGSGNVVMSASPTLTGTVTAATINATTLGGTLSTAAQTNITSVGTLANLTVTNPITGSVTGSSGSTTGNAATATALQTARNINGVSFNGTADITVTAAAGTLTGNTLASNVLASSLTSVGTLSSLTVSGDLTVDTNVLKVDSSANNVIVGATSTTAKLAVANNSNDGTSDSRQYGIFGTAATYLGSDAAGIWGGGLGEVQIHNGTATRPAMLSLGGSLNAAEGLGTINFFRSGNEAGYRSRAQILSVGTNTGTANRYGGDLRFYTAADGATNPTERLRIDASGNLGLGVTPSATSASGYRSFELGTTAGAGITAAGGDLYINNNAYVAGGAWKYAANSVVTAQYNLSGGVHKWFTAPSGTAGNAISWTTAMTLDASGNLGVGETSPATRLHVAGANTSARGQLTVVGSSADARQTFYNGSTFCGAIAFGTTDSYVQTVSNSPLRFFTNDTERARITSGGYFKAAPSGTYPGSASSVHEFSASVSDIVLYTTNTASSNPYGMVIEFTAAAPNDTTRYFLNCADNASGGTRRATIRSNGGLANYQSNNADLSDARTKTDITPAASMWDKVAALEIVTYKYNDQTHDDVNLGVIAQQVETVEPVWVDPDGFGETPEGDEPLKMVYTKDITFAAIKALQEAMTRIEALEARLEALEA